MSNIHDTNEWKSGYDDGFACQPPFPPTAFDTNSEYEAYMNGYRTGEQRLSLRGNVVSSASINFNADSSED
jgi:hypothetical protein